FFKKKKKKKKKKKIGDKALEAAKTFSLLRDDCEITEEAKEMIEVLWKDKGIQQTYKKRSRFGVVDSSGYFFNEIERIASAHYIPSTEDVIHSRHRTTGVVDKTFEVEGTRLRIFDVGKLAY
ncbi:hypothetical protein RFI_16467, partial [Reticulomyxa filosa]